MARDSSASDGHDAEQAAITLESIADAILTADTAGNVTYLNSAAEAMTGWSRGEATGRPVDQVLHIVDGSTREPLKRPPLRLALEGTEPVALPPNSVLVRRDGFECPVEDSTAAIHGRDGRVIGAVTVFHDVSEAREVALKMSYLACHDSMTKLPNRLLLHDRITQAIALAFRNDKQLAVLFIDLDGFKPVNDSLGHAVGDELIRSVALRLTASVRSCDTVSRCGGDEFVVLLSEIAYAEHAALSAARIIAAVAAPHELLGHKLRVTASVGVAVYPIDGANADTLLKSADAAMYQAKVNGGNGYWFSSQGMPAATARPDSARFG